MSLKVGVVGATGMVGEVFLDLLNARKFPVSELRPFASEKSEGLKIPFRGEQVPVQSLKPGCFKDLDLVFFSSGDEISRDWAPQAVAAGAFAVDNSAAFRMADGIPLVVPEINSHRLPPKDQPRIIANPNCSTIQLVMALHPLRAAFGLSAVRVASYQAVSGAGRAAQEELAAQTQAYLSGERSFRAVNFAHPIVFNCIPQIGGFADDGFCSEERKIRFETRKILELPELKVSAWTVRVPTMNAHSEVSWITLKRTVSRTEVIDTLKAMPGVVVHAGSEASGYPLAIQAAGTDPVYVGRIHQDPDEPQTWMLWIVADNLRKGAALNGIQIAEKIFFAK